MKSKVKQFQKTTNYAYLVITFAAMLYIVGIQGIMQVAQVLSSEFDAIPLVVTLLVPKLTPFFGLLYGAINLPLILLFWKKLRRQFLVRTLYFLFVSIAFSSIFFIPGVESTLQGLIVNRNMVASLKWPMFVLPALGGAIVGAAAALAWKYGGSTGGIDFVVFYLSTKRKKNVGTTLFVSSLIVMLLAFFVMIGIKKEVREVWLPTLSGSIIYIIVMSMIINLIFPKYKKVQIEIHSTKVAEITKFLKKTHGHPFRIESATSGYLETEMHYITTVILILEQKDFSKAIKKIDSQAWIAAIPVANVFGRFNTKSVDGS